MPDRDKVRLMTRLALFEEKYGRMIRKAESTSRIDLITNPVWRWGFIVTLLFFAAAGVLAAFNIDMVLDSAARDQTRNLIMTVLIAWLSTLAVTVVISSVLSVARERRLSGLVIQYRQMLGQLERSAAMSDRNNRSMDSSSDEDVLWDEPSGGAPGHRRRRGHEEDLDYRNMQVLEFEDDDYCYYVEAVPKRGGRRG